MTEYRDSGHAVFDLKYHMIWYEIPIQDIARAGSRACARPDSTDLPSTGGCHRARSGIADSGSSEVGAVHQRAILPASAGRISGTAEALLGTTYVGPWITSARRWAR